MSKLFHAKNKKMKHIDEYRDKTLVLHIVENIKKTLQETDRQTKCLMLTAHGLISFASSLSEAYDIAELTEETAKISFISQNIGRR